MKQSLAKRLLIYFSAILMFAYISGPFLYTIYCSFKAEPDLRVKFLEFIPKHGFTLFNYRFVLGLVSSPSEWKEMGPYFGLAQFATAVSANIPRAIFNSIVVGLAVAFVTMFLSSMAGYGFVKFDFPFKRGSLLLITLVRFIPGLAMIVPIYITFKYFMIIDTYLALILSYLIYTLPFSTWLMIGYFESIPRELGDAAQIDGCSHFDVLTKVYLPISLPGLAAVMIYSFMFSWGEFFFALILTSSMNAKTLPVLLSNAVTEANPAYGPINAIAAIAVIPSIILTLLTHKMLVRGLLGGAVKG